MQFSVPQFTDVEDKIVGPLTLRQFFILLAGGVVVLVVFRFAGNFLLFIIFALPVVGVFAFAAFGSYNGKSFGDLIVTGLSFFAEPNSFVFRKGEKGLAQVKRQEKPPKTAAASDLSPEEKLSRLHKLTYILDQDAKEEEQLLKEKYVHLK
ncbi:MAG: PrgI family protein [Patescibacteria group bacterium]|nr:PrgI family protein [Patescibacteria group bacterium]